MSDTKKDNKLEKAKRKPKIPKPLAKVKRGHSNLLRSAKEEENDS